MRTHRLLLFPILTILAACSTSYPTDTPGVTQSSRYVALYDGPEIKAELIYRWASDHLGHEWLVLKISLTAAPGGSPTVDAKNIRVRTNDGRELPLMERKEFQRVAPKIRIALESMDAWGPPARRLEGLGRACEVWFLAPAGTFADRSSIRLQTDQWCSGPLVFTPMVGVQAGRWVLMIDLEESTARIPFELGEQTQIR